ncbi:MAG TPA: NAD-dependent deacylase [Nitriliruptorales bacterium]|nr:NAD-dependent deacylase [Nitriliruptorales bacterium]
MRWAEEQHGSDALRELAQALDAAQGEVVVLSGAGVSVSSDIPAFRGRGGLWHRYDPLEYAHIEAFLHTPEKVWRMLRELDAVLEAASPNPAHDALAELERLGLVRSVITQNVDGLHQAAGSETVIELHGSRRTLSCVDCGATVGREQVLDTVERGDVPRCERCGGLLKPDVVLFGEALPAGALERARDEVRDCQILLVVGTSAEVEPAASLPALGAGHGAEVWDINPEPSGLPRDLQGPGSAGRRLGLHAEEALPRLVRLLRADDR